MFDFGDELYLEGNQYGNSNDVNNDVDNDINNDINNEKLPQESQKTSGFTIIIGILAILMINIKKKTEKNYGKKR